MTVPPMAGILPALTATHQQPSLKLLTPTTQPIPLISAPISKSLSAAHTLGVLIYYYVRSSHLIANPLQTLIGDLAPILTIQALFCALCLPSSGLWYSGIGTSGKGQKILEGSATTSRSSRGTGAATGGSGGSLRKRPGAPVMASGKSTGAGQAVSDPTHILGGTPQSRILPTILSTLLTLTVPPVPLFILSLVLGAPLYPTTLLPHTLALSLHVSILAFLPLFYTHGITSAAWRDIVAAWLPFDEAGVWAGSVGCMVGGWIGAVPMALDWDRDWQVWPCTVLWGCVAGWGVGRVITGVLGLGIGRRIDLSAGPEAVESTSRKRLEDAQEKIK